MRLGVTVMNPGPVGPDEQPPDSAWAKWRHWLVSMVVLFAILSLCVVSNCVVNDWELKRVR
jgi:hypothetical protein